MARVAIVTGGGSGIGRALSAGLVRRGDNVVVADLDGPAAEAVAAELSARGPGDASAATLDVRDAAAVAELVTQIVDRHGRLDLMFNNAGVGMGGPTEQLTVAHWDRAIDVNLRGVVNGVQAAYPVMLRQGHGHLVNTASAAGLLPSPFQNPYAATKWAVVGLSLSLRAEAAGSGVRVSVVCPGLIDTPILDKGLPPDLPPVPVMADLDLRAAWRKAGLGPPMPAQKLAEVVLRGVERNRAVITAPGYVRAFWWMFRLSPALMGRAMGSGVRRQFGHPRTRTSPSGTS